MRGDLVAFLFTDIEGSTRLLERLGERYRELLAEHHRLLREAIANAGGREVHAGGDSFFSVFPSTRAAARCAVQGQLQLSARDWPEGTVPRIRMGVHTGIASSQDGDLVGMDVHRAARVMAVAHGGQVLLTEQAASALGASVEVRDLGYHRLKDLPAPEHLFQLLAPGLRTEFPPLRSLNRSNLPTPANPLVGRSSDVPNALARLARPEVRILTMLGPGGAGKTRLAIEVAAEAAGRYRDGVWLVLLAPLQEPELMVSEIARVLDVEPTAGEPIERALTTTLADRELLLVLDNCEHLLAAASVVAGLIAGAPHVDVLATSREPLRISGEHRLDIPPLPPRDAVELFVQRALAVRPDLELETQDAQAIERICDRLDGLPLAVELAAARASVFSPRALEARLAEGLPLPTGPRDFPARHRTLRSTIDWSYRLLDEFERSVLVCLSPFVGGVRLDTAEQLWGIEGVEALISLAEKSLLRRRDDADDEPRFWMLELIRQYAAEAARAKAGSADAVVRHARCYFSLTEEARPNLIGPDQRVWLDRLERDHANLRAALEHLSDQGSDDALRMASTLTWFWDMRGYQPEARWRLAEALARAPTDSPNRADALHCAGWMSWNQSDPEAAEPLLREARELVEHSTDTRLVAEVCLHSAFVAELLGDHDQAVELYERGIAVARSGGDSWALGVGLADYALMRSLRSDTRREVALLDEALDVLRPTGDRYMVSLTMANRAEVALNAGDLESAQSLSDEARALAREIEFRPLIAGTLELGAVLALDRGDVEAASALLREAIDTSRPFQDESRAMRLILGGTLAAIARRPIDAATLWGAAERVYACIGLAEPPFATRLRMRWEAQALADAPDQIAWDAAWKGGAELAVEDALAVAAGSQEPVQVLDRAGGLETAL